METTQKISFDFEIKEELKKCYTGSDFEKTGIVDGRIEQLLTIHNAWLAMAKRIYSADVIAKKLYIYDVKLGNVKTKQQMQWN